MPPKVTKKRQQQIDAMKEGTIAEISEKMESSRSWLEAKRDEMIREVMTEPIDLPQEILRMNLLDFLKRDDFSEFFESSVAPIKEEIEVDMEDEDMGRCSGLSKETDIPTTANTTPDRAPMAGSRVLKTPCGVSLPVPAVIRLKVENDQDNLYRKPRNDEEIAFSIYGSPLAIQSSKENQNDADVETIRKALNNIGDQSPDSRALAETVKKLLRKKQGLEAEKKVKEEEDGTAV